MRCVYCVILICSLPVIVFAQPGNRKPRITDQRDLSTNEEQPITIQMLDVEVRDRDDPFYPFGFTMRLYPGENYTLNQNTVVPALNFNGELRVPVTVNDGHEDSNPYNLRIQVRPVNDVPEITGQGIVSTNEDQAIGLLPSHLVINDPDDNQFTISVGEGSNYTVSGQTVTPAPNFSGTLSIPVRVSDGDASSGVYNLQVTVNAVNDAPQITGQLPLETEQNRGVAILLSHLTVSDPDNTYPNGFTISVLPSADGRYTVSGNTVTPGPQVEGMIPVSVRVNDGQANSAPFAFQLKVNPSKNAPVITGQVAVSSSEDEAFTVQFGHLVVSDADNPYPNGFTLRVLAGPNYTSTGNTITPSLNFSGPLTVNVLVNDGKSDSNTFGLVVSIRPVNDPPVISNVETEPLSFNPGMGDVAVSSLLEVADPDNDSLVSAEVTIKAGSYRPGLDQLVFQAGTSIKGTFDRNQGVLTLSGSATVADYVKALRSVMYRFDVAANLPFEAKTILFRVNDGKTASEIVERRISNKDVIVNLDIPTAFTPNGDSANDTWSVKPVRQSEEIESAIVRIYNKKGVLLFEAEGLDKEWDGRLNGELLPADTYFYTIDLDLEFSKRFFKGLVTILR